MQSFTLILCSPSYLWITNWINKSRNWNETDVIPTRTRWVRSQPFSWLLCRFLFLIPTLANFIEEVLCIYEEPYNCFHVSESIRLLLGYNANVEKICLLSWKSQNYIHFKKKTKETDHYSTLTLEIFLNNLKQWLQRLHRAGITNSNAHRIRKEGIKIETDWFKRQQRMRKTMVNS